MYSAEFTCIIDVNILLWTCLVSIGTCSMYSSPLVWNWLCKKNILNFHVLLIHVHVCVCFCRSGTNITVRIPVPKATVSVSHEALGPGQVTELRLSDKVYTWKVKKIDGGEEQILLLKVFLVTVM